MTKFLFIYRSDKDTFDTMGPEEIQQFHPEGTLEGWRGSVAHTWEVRLGRRDLPA